MGKITEKSHDRLFRRTLHNIERAKEFFETYLPDKIRQKVDLNTIALTPNEFIKKDLTALQSDVIYRCQIDNQPGYLYNITEHFSQPDEMLPFRANEYKYALIRWYYKNIAKQYTPSSSVVPIPRSKNTLPLRKEYPGIDRKVQAE